MKKRTLRSLMIFAFMALWLIGGMGSALPLDNASFAFAEQAAMVSITKIALNKTSSTLQPGQTLQLATKLTPSNADEAVVWESSDEAVATVSGAGLVTAVADGKATISARSAGGNVRAACAVTVKTVAVKTVTMNKKTAALSPGEGLQLQAKVAPSNATYKAVTWTSSDENVAAVDDTGKVSAKSLGTATITARASNGKAAACKITVRYIKVTSVKLNKTSATLRPTGTLKLTATTKPANAHDRGVIWTSSNPLVATVDANGNVTATLKTGTATITATAQDGSGRKAGCKVTVKITKIAKIKLNKSSATIPVYGTGKLTAKITPSNAYDKTILWTSSNPAVASVDVDGVVTANFEGKATITARAIDGSNKKASCKITVKAVRVKKLDLGSASQVILDVGETHQYTAAVTPANATYKAVTWESSNTGVATVDESGKVTALSAGLVTITAKTDNGKLKATRQIRVLPQEVATYRALVVGSFSTRTAKDYMPFVGKNITNMVEGVKNAGSYSSIKHYKPLKNKTEVKSAIQQAFGTATEDDVSVIYLVTHGQSGKVSFEGGKSMTYAEFLTMLKPVKGQIVVIVSACNSGSLITKLKSKPADELMSRINILTGAQNGVKCCGVMASTEDASIDFFTSTLLAGIGWDYSQKTAASKGADTNGDGKITVGEMFGYTAANVPLEIRKYTQLYGTKKPFTGNVAQVPQVYISNSKLVLFQK